MYSEVNKNKTATNIFLIFKRVFDFVLSGVGLIVFTPFFIVIFYLIYIEDGGYVFFKQERVGKDGKIFKIIKFRSMKICPVTHLDQDLLETDPRVTRIGRLLRATAMDELPQLINILKGQMSFVGPKPLLYVIDDEERIHYKTLADVCGYSTRIKMIPGLTGIAQVYSKKTVSKRVKFRYDKLYLESRNLCLDIKLIFLSVFITLRAKWETAERKI